MRSVSVYRRCAGSYCHAQDFISLIKESQMAAKYVYFFGNGNAEGDASMKNLLGGKGANLAEMTSIGLPVPPGFTISTEVCTYYYDNGQTYPPALAAEVKEHLQR